MNIPLTAGVAVNLVTGPPLADPIHPASAGPRAAPSWKAALAESGSGQNKVASLLNFHRVGSGGNHRSRAELLRRCVPPAFGAAVWRVSPCRPSSSCWRRALSHPRPSWRSTCGAPTRAAGLRPAGPCDSPRVDNGGDEKSVNSSAYWQGRCASHGCKSQQRRNDANAPARLRRRLR